MVDAREMGMTEDEFFHSCPVFFCEQYEIFWHTLEMVIDVDKMKTYCAFDGMTGAIIDELLLYAATTIGKPVPVTFLIACIVAMWLICNEIISILENIQDMGVNIPVFLQPLVKHIRSQVEERINIDEKDEKDSEGE